MSYWTVAQLKPHGTRLALYCLTLAGYQIYQPRLRERRVVRGRRVDTELPLFPGYAFVVVELQWHSARWAPGVIRLVMDGMQPARVPDGVIDAIKRRERNGAVELPKRDFVPGDRIRICARRVPRPSWALRWPDRTRTRPRPAQSVRRSAPSRAVEGAAFEHAS